MTVLPSPTPGTHIDEDTDDMLRARGDIRSIQLTLNQVLSYLSDLFGFDGSKQTAINTLFSNQAVLFPSGTRMYFMQATVPPGWVKFSTDIGRYLMVVSDDTGGHHVGNYNEVLTTAPTALAREHLPSVTLTGVTDFQGWHGHDYQYTYFAFTGPAQGSAKRRSESELPLHFWYSGATTSGAGNHAHNISIPLGGANWGHSHLVSMQGYRPQGWKGVIGTKI